MLAFALQHWFALISTYAAVLVVTLYFGLRQNRLR